VFVSTATRVVVGASSRSTATHFEPTAGSKLVAPVTLPPGFAKLWTMWLRTGSATVKNTIGIVFVAAIAATVSGELQATINSQPRSTNSVAR
jgi:hypothetical protein